MSRFRMMSFLVTLIAAIFEWLFGLWSGFATLIIGFMFIGLAFIRDLLADSHIVWELILWFTTALLIVTLALWFR